MLAQCSRDCVFFTKSFAHLLSLLLLVVYLWLASNSTSLSGYVAPSQTIANVHARGCNLLVSGHGRAGRFRVRLNVF